MDDWKEMNTLAPYRIRMEENVEALRKTYSSLYGDRSSHFEDLLRMIHLAFDNRKQGLKIQDLQRLEDTGWSVSEQVVGMSLYVDLFSGELDSFKEKLPYLQELGINYIHFMPVLKTRAGKNDGGFAVSSFTEINPQLGTMDEFEQLLDALRMQGIHTCIDFVLNHTADDHEWAVKARQGDAYYQGLYMMYDTREIPDLYDQTLPFIFPEASQSNFVVDPETGKWVCSIFYDYQWDLNYKNPALFNKMAETMLYLLNRGVDVLRLDAIPHIWKELGTNGFNLPQVHDVVGMLRRIVYMVAPGAVFKGETIGASRDIAMYFGDQQNGLQYMYNFPMMTGLWNALATSDATYLRLCLEELPKLGAGNAWINYVRCHDDIAWLFEEEVLQHMAVDKVPFVGMHTDFYVGQAADSFSRGEAKPFSEKAKEAKTSGTAASLCGLEKAVECNDAEGAETACKRMLLLHSIALSYEGIPMIYSGDEIGMLNDYSYASNMDMADDSRWLHRPKMDWTKALKRNEDGTPEQMIFKGLQHLISVRRQHALFHSDVHSTLLDARNKAVLAYFKTNGKERLLVLCNFSSGVQDVSGGVLEEQGFGGIMRDAIEGEQYQLNDGISLRPYEFLWLHETIT